MHLLRSVQRRRSSRKAANVTSEQVKHATTPDASFNEAVPALPEPEPSSIVVLRPAQSDIAGSGGAESSTSRRATLEDLPDEIVLEIVELASWYRFAVARLRLCSRRLCRIASRSLRIHLTYGRSLQTFERFKVLAANKAILSGVIELAFFDHQPWTELKSFENYRLVVRLIYKVDVSRSTWRVWRQLLDAQEEVMNQGLDFRALHDALPYMSRLHSVYFHNSTTWALQTIESLEFGLTNETKKEIYFYMGIPEGRKMIANKLETALKKPADPIQRQDRARAERLIANMRRWYLRYQLRFPRCIQLWLDTQHRARDDVARRVVMQWGGNMPLPVFELGPSMRGVSQQLCDFVGGLRCLTLQLQHKVPSWPMQAQLELQRMFRCAVNLEELRLWGVLGFSLEDLQGNELDVRPMFPKLKKLTFTRGYFLSHQFAAFLSQHDSTLDLLGLIVTTIEMSPRDPIHDNWFPAGDTRVHCLDCYLKKGPDQSISKAFAVWLRGEVQKNEHGSSLFFSQKYLAPPLEVVNAGSDITAVDLGRRLSRSSTYHHLSQRT